MARVFASIVCDDRATMRRKLRGLSDRRTMERPKSERGLWPETLGQGLRRMLFHIAPRLGHKRPGQGPRALSEPPHCAVSSGLLKFCWKSASAASIVISWKIVVENRRAICTSQYTCTKCTFSNRRRHYPQFLLRAFQPSRTMESYFPMAWVGLHRLHAGPPAPGPRVPATSHSGSSVG